ncbi:MAG: hypothetical protein M1825_005744 [Sarcosagium campestre]|nr:MAG: hypothetical protein M1825_005744 [Sarcosagium campestre]
MSLESALDEERMEVLKLLDVDIPKKRQTRNASGSRQDAKGRTDSPGFPRSPVRSMLDVPGEPSSSRHASIAGTGVGVTQPAPLRPPQSAPLYRSMLDPPTSPPAHVTARTPHSHSASTSPTDAPRSYRPSGRALSDVGALPSNEGPRTLLDMHRSSQSRPINSPNADYQFEMLPSIRSNVVPKRVTQGGSRQSKKSGSMSHAVQAGELGVPPSRGNDRGRNSIATTGTRTDTKSQSPGSHARLGRSQSPHHSRLNTNSFNLLPNPGKFVSDRGKVVDMNNAYRRLSDVHLARSAGSLATLGKSGPEHFRSDSGETLSPSGEARLQKDYDYGSGQDEGAVDSSEDDSEESSGTDLDSKGRRGRDRDRKKRSGTDGEDGEGEAGPSSGNASGPLGMGRASGPRKTLSLLAAADQERDEVSNRYKVRSLLPPLTVTGPGGESSRPNPRRAGVHPTTNFDRSFNSPMNSDTEEDLSEIAKAQRLNMSVTSISSTPESHRVIRTIIRGEFSKMQQEADKGLRRQRTYLIATDLSEDAAHALEWSIGTILRDGDTMLAVYAVDAETGTGATGESAAGVSIGEGARAYKEHDGEIGGQTHKAISSVPSPLPSPLGAPALTHSTHNSGESPDTRDRSKAEQERFHACEDLTQRCIRLLRKTRLQVRMVIEVIHCKSPKHLITEVIDFVEPTLVILGSRGRTNITGVLLGSFSNYLVSKSSVPVMVARRKLRKHAKYKRANLRLSNNLTPTRALADAKID